MACVKEIVAVDALAIRDDTVHTPATDADECVYVDVHDCEMFTVYVDNQLDVAVSVRAYHNRVKSTTKAIASGVDALSVATVSQDARTFTPSNAGWLPWLYLQLQCGSAPSSGAVTVHVIKFKKMRA